MGNLIYILFISIFFPLFLMMLLVEKKARLPIVFVMVGIFISVFASEVNGVLLGKLNITRYDATITLAPITEELLKALPIKRIKCRSFMILTLCRAADILPLGF